MQERIDELNAEMEQAMDKKEFLKILLLKVSLINKKFRKLF
ncbi:hypothetical protein P4446_15750 [Bacillus tropicus]|nr:MULTISPECIES: hypothetical protein [Bacillus cereus group]MED3380613.1 hypothetical protein [Bacillus tropicus]